MRAELATGLAAWLAVAACDGPARPETTASSDAIFSSVCARCHGIEGRGGLPSDAGPAPRNFHDRAFQADRTDAQLRAAIVGGKNGAMPAFGHSFSEPVLDGLVARIRSFNSREESP